MSERAPDAAALRSEKSAAVVVLENSGKDQTEEGKGVIVFASVVRQKSLASRELTGRDRSGTPIVARSAEMQVER